MSNENTSTPSTTIPKKAVPKTRLTFDHVARELAPHSFNPYDETHSNTKDSGTQEIQDQLKDLNNGPVNVSINKPYNDSLGNTFPVFLGRHDRFRLEDSGWNNPLEYLKLPPVQIHTNEEMQDWSANIPYKREDSRKNFYRPTRYRKPSPERQEKVTQRQRRRTQHFAARALERDTLEEAEELKANQLRNLALEKAEKKRMKQTRTERRRKKFEVSNTGTFCLFSIDTCLTHFII